MDNNALSQYLQQKNQLASPEQINAPILDQLSQGNDDVISQLAQSKQQLTNALSAYQQGKATQGDVSNASSAFAGLCQKWAEQQAYGHSGIYPSASAAWSAYSGKGEAKSDPSLKGAKPGDLVYLQDPNQSDGHVGVYNGNGQFTSATYNGIQKNDLGAWQKSTNQKILGYVPMGKQ